MSLNRRLPHFICLTLVWFCTFATDLANGQDFELKDGDRIVLIGSEFIEQQIKHNFFESSLSLNWPGRKLQFRNLGWAGDTPSGIARGYFKGAEEGFRRLMEELDRIDPTVILVCYGANAGPDEFGPDFRKLISELRKRTERIVAISHPAALAKQTHFNKSFADITNANVIRAANAKTMQQIVKEQGVASIQFIDLYQLSSGLEQTPNELTHDTIRFNQLGYQKLANELSRAFGCNNPSSSANDNALRTLIADKNELYFHRYRPQNETYLRGFRKHEQGQNAKEIAEFDALIENAEARIMAKLNGNPLPKPTAEPAPIKLSFEAASIEEEKSTFRLADGLSVNLFAAEPMVANPIHMNFDSRGRLWVATSPIYPQIKPGAKPKDQIIVLEDMDNDGLADKSTVFADDLLIPTAVLPDERGGAYVANSTELLHLEDTDGDGKADRRRVILSGFGTEDTHHIIHTFRWGPDAAIYFNQSIYIHTHMETPGGVKRLMGSGIWRFEPNKVNATIGLRGLVNPWGHIFNDWGQNFATDGAGGDGINYAFPGSAYVSAVGFSSVLRGMNPGQPKLCGLEIVSGRHFPNDWQGLLVASDFRGNRIKRFEIGEQDSGYTSKEIPDLLSSTHRAFRPVDMKMGPDGSLFVADWYNPIINHGEVDFRDSRRDYKHGRIWRVTVDGREQVKPVDFESATLDELVGMMTRPEQWVRTKAKVEFKLRYEADPGDGSEYINAVSRLTESEVDRDMLEGIWSLDAIGKLRLETLSPLLKSKNHRVRAAALRIASNQTENLKSYANLVAPMASDPHPQVRLEFINAWRQLMEPSNVDALADVISSPKDKYIQFALVNALNDSRKHWISELTELEFAKDEPSLTFVLQNVKANETVEPMLNLLADSTDPAQSAQLVSLICTRGSAKQLQQLLKLCLEKPAIVPFVSQPLLTAVSQRKIKLKIPPEQLAPLMNSPGGVQLAGIWKITGLKEQVKSILADPKSSRPMKVAAIKGLLGYGEQKMVRDLAANPNPLETRRIAIDALAATNLNLAAKLAIDFFNDCAKNNRAKLVEQTLPTFLKRKTGGQALTQAIKQNPLPDSLVNLVYSKANSAGAIGKPLANALKGLATTKMRKKLTDAEIQQIVAEVASRGNAARGESIYRRDELNCIKCHAIGGAGGVVGPDMISLGASSPVDYIVQSLVDPNAKIKEGYHTTSILTFEGVQYTGKLMSQADGKVILRDADNKRIEIVEDDIDEQKISTNSLMPAELTEKLNRNEFIDLVTFLSSLGKEGDYKISSESLVRRWELEDKTVRYSKVSGLLPISDITTQFVSFDFDVVSDGTIGFEIEKSGGLRITLDDMKDNLSADKIVKDLTKGRHRLTFRVNKNRQGLRVKLIDVPGSKGRAVLINQ